MIDFTAIRNAIFTGLNAHLDCLVVEANQGQHKPPYPYMTILFSGPFGSSQTHTGKVYIGDNGDDDIDYRRTKDEMLSISLTSISGDGAVAHQNAANAAEWFKWVGYDVLKVAGMTVVDTGAVANRDILIVDAFEKRSGFDVRLRVLSDVTRKESYIGQLERSFDDGTTEIMDLKLRELI